MIIAYLVRQLIFANITAEQQGKWRVREGIGFRGKHFKELQLTGGFYTNMYHTLSSVELDSYRKFGTIFLTR